MFNKELIKGLSTVFGWTPGLILCLAAVFSSITGLVSILNSSWLVGIVLIVIGVMGVLGFIALTSICWGLKLKLHTRFTFLLCGVIASTLVCAVGFSGIAYWFTLYVGWVNVYLYVSPLIVSIIHLRIHARLLKKANT